MEKCPITVDSQWCPPHNISGHCALFMVNMLPVYPLAAQWWSLAVSMFLLWSVCPLCISLLLSGGHWMLLCPLYGQYAPCVSPCCIAVVISSYCAPLIVNMPLVYILLLSGGQYAPTVSPFHYWSLKTIVVA